MLALKFAWEVQKDFDAVIFQTCGQRPLDVITAELADRLPIDVKTRPPEEQRAAAKEWLRERQSLLVLDDVWPNEAGKVEVRQLEPGPACSVLYTSRLKALPGLSSELREQVESLPRRKRRRCFTAISIKISALPKSRNIARHCWTSRARSSGCRLRSRSAQVCCGKNRPARWGERCSRLRLDALTDGARNVNALFGTAIASQPEREQRMFAACAVCVQEGFWLPLAAEVAELSEDEAEDAAERLVHSSLLRVIDRERRRFQLHALLREQVREKEGDGFVKLQERHAMALEKLFKDWETRWQECRECLEEVIQVAGFLWRQGEISREAWLTYWGYSTGLRIGELDAALRILQQEVLFWEGRDDREAKGALMRSYGNQAVILRAWGRLEEALALHKKQEPICLELGDRVGLYACYGNQALILQAWGRLEEALALHKKEEAICLELGNKDGLQACYGNQALILKAWGRLEEALALHKEEETICLELGNKDGLGASYGNQALILQAWGRLEEALALHKKEETICLELGNKDSLQISYGNQALILKAWGRLEEALALLKQQEAICLELGNKDSLQISYGNQALILKAWGRLEEALALHKQQEGICLELGNKASLGNCHANWGLLARAQGGRETAKEKLEQALAIFTELKMPRERDAVQAELEKVDSG